MQRRTVLWVLALLFWPGQNLLPAVVCAGEARISELVVANSPQDLLVYISLVDTFDDETRKGVANGLPVSFRFNVEVNRVRPGLPDSTIISQSFDHVLSFDTLKNEYQVSRHGAGREEVRVASLAEAEALMNEVHDYRLVPLANLEKDAEYLLRMKVRQVRKTLPFNIHYLIPFYSLGDFSIGWQAIKFHY